MCEKNINKDSKILIPTVYEQQIILTCKGHNKNKDTIEGIRKILSQQFNLETKYIHDNVIYRWLIKIVKQYANCRDIDNFINGLFEIKTEITVVEAINNLISILSSIDVFDKNGQELIYLEKNDEILNWVGK